jgi:PAS domain S-box-containing protein
MLQKSLEPAQLGSSEHSSQMRWIDSAGLAMSVGIAYFLAARLSLFFQTEPDGVAVFWPAAGVSSGVLIALGRFARWPVAIGVIAATITANLTSDRTFWSASVFALCNAGEALFAAWLIERYIGPDFTLDRLRRVIALLLAAIISTALSGMGGALGYKLLHSPDAPFLTTWYNWFASDAMGIITVAPLIVGLVAAVREPPPRDELSEGVTAVLAITVATAAMIFVLPAGWRDFVLPVELLFPLLLWLAARCRPVFSSAAVFAVSLILVSAITFRLGFFGRVGSPVELRILGVQAGILGVALCALVLAALFAERRSHIAHAIDNEDRMRAIVNTVVDAIITIDDRGVIETLNPAAARVFGYNADEVVGRNVRMLMPEPYRREHDGYIRNFLTTGEAKIIGLGREIAGQRKDGTIFPLELAVSEMTVGGQRMFTGVVRDITERRQTEHHQTLLVAELDHRVKNILAQVAAVAKSTRQGSQSVDEFIQSLDGRIRSMAAAHTLLSQSGWQSVGLDALVRYQLAPYATNRNITISGTEIMLTAAQIQAVARVLHELVTNAAKHGALSVPSGRIFVTWDIKQNQDDSILALAWRELDGPSVGSNVRPGYGTTLIRDLIPHELGGVVELLFATDGVKCNIEIVVEDI